MKYIITESMAKKMAFEAIKDKIGELNMDRTLMYNFIIYSLRDEDDIGVNSVIIEYDSEDGRLYVDPKPFEFILSMFGMDNNEDDTKQFFMDWFEHYEGIRPEYVDF
jgi:hypothetical protein